MQRDYQINEKDGDVKEEGAGTRTNVVAVDELDFDGKEPVKHGLHAGVGQGQYLSGWLEAFR